MVEKKGLQNITQEELVSTTFEFVIRYICTNKFLGASNHSQRQAIGTWCSEEGVTSQDPSLPVPTASHVELPSITLSGHLMMDSWGIICPCQLWYGQFHAPLKAYEGSDWYWQQFMVSICELKTQLSEPRCAGNGVIAFYNSFKLMLRTKTASL